jgi:hypothetical protein
VSTVNAVYVLVAVGRLSNVALLFVQAALGTFKLAWSAWVIPSLLAWAFERSSLQLPNWIFMILFVFLGAPFASSFSESSSCFLYVLTMPRRNSFSFIISSVNTEAVCGTNGCQFVSITEPSIIRQSILPPWMYSYQCSSAVITGYAPVLFMAYLMSGAVVPFVLLAAAHCPEHYFAAVRRALPPTMLKLLHVDKSSVACLLKSIIASNVGKRMSVKFILNLAVMLTFGLTVPLLNLAVICDTSVHLGMTIVLLNRSISFCEGSEQDGELIRQEFWNNFSLEAQEIRGCCFIVLGYVSVFWSLFAFDWIGDVHGALAGGLTMLLPLLLPTLIGFILLRRQRLGEQVMMKGPEDDIELSEIMNPVIFPQSTATDTQLLV